MTSAPRLKFKSNARLDPLQPSALVVSIEKSEPLLKALYRRPLEQLGSLRGLVSSDLLMLLGEENHLPWVPGATYLGFPAGSSTFLIPTLSTLSTPVDIAENALRRRLGLDEAFAFVPTEALGGSAEGTRDLVIPLSSAYRLDPDGLNHFVTEVALLRHLEEHSE